MPDAEGAPPQSKRPTLLAASVAAALLVVLLGLLSLQLRQARRPRRKKSPPEEQQQQQQQQQSAAARPAPQRAAQPPPPRPPAAAAAPGGRAVDFSPPRPPQVPPLHAVYYPPVDVAAVLGPLVPLRLVLSTTIYTREDRKGGRAKTDACVSAQLQQWRRMCQAGLRLRVFMHVTEPWPDKEPEMRAAERGCGENALGSLAVTLVMASKALKLNMIHQYRKVWAPIVAQNGADWYLVYEEDGAITLEHIAVLIAEQRRLNGTGLWPQLIRVEPYRQRDGSVEFGLLDAQMGGSNCAFDALWWLPNHTEPYLAPCQRYSAFTFADASLTRLAAQRRSPPFVARDDLCGPAYKEDPVRRDGFGPHLGHTCREQFSQWWPPWGWWGDWTGSSFPVPVLPLVNWRNFMVTHLDNKATWEANFTPKASQFWDHGLSMEEALRCLTAADAIPREGRERGRCHTTQPIRVQEIATSRNWRGAPLQAVGCPGAPAGAPQCQKALFSSLIVHRYKKGPWEDRCECRWAGTDIHSRPKCVHCRKVRR